MQSCLNYYIEIGLKFFTLLFTSRSSILNSQIQYFKLLNLVFIIFTLMPSQQSFLKYILLYVCIYFLFSGLKIMLVCFENDLVKDWPRIAHTIRDMSKVSEARQLYWNFIDFLVSQRSPVFVLLLPFISQKVKFHRILKNKLLHF